jgi:hypothetical protein
MILIWTFYGRTSCQEKFKFITEEYFTKHSKHLQWILEQKVFTKFIKNTKLRGLGRET